MTTNSGGGAPGPFERLLGRELDGLPEPVRRFHALRAPLESAGRAEIKASSRWTARLLCLLAGLPRPGHDVPCAVVFTPLGDGREHWQRNFGSRRYASVVRAARTTRPDEGRWLIERFGPLGLIDLHFRLTPGAAGLAWVLEGWRLLGLPLPAATLPRIACLESGGGKRFHFDIDVAFPLVGHVIHYAGWLEAVEPCGGSRPPDCG